MEGDVLKAVRALAEAIQRGERLLRAPGTYVSLDGGRSVTALLGPLGNGWLRADAYLDEAPHEWGMEVVDDPGESHCIVLLFGQAAGPEEAKEKALALGGAALEALKTLGEHPRD